MGDKRKKNNEKMKKSADNSRDFNIKTATKTPAKHQQDD
jgi:hypothetical protein